jgi:haloalkane dehalogenase
MNVQIAGHMRPRRVRLATAILASLIIALFAAAQAGAGVASADFPFVSKWVEVDGTKMHYVEVGQGDPILYIHGVPTSAYLWRNVLPHTADVGRSIAVDLVGFGRSETPDAENLGFTTQAKHLNGFIEAQGLKNVTLVLHDWGVMLGFNYAATHSDNVRAIAFLEGLIAPVEDASYFPSPAGAPPPLPVLMGPELADEMIINQNIYVEGLIPAMTVRTLSAVEMQHYREPFPDQSRRKVLLDLMSDVPFKGQPEDAYNATTQYAEWLKETPTPKLLFHATPGAAVREDNGAVESIRRLPNTTVVNLGPGIHFLQEDYPTEIGEGIASWLSQIKE